MIVTIKCQHCGKKSQVEDMGGFRCEHCGQFFVSISEYIKDKMLGDGRFEG